MNIRQYQLGELYRRDTDKTYKVAEKDSFGFNDILINLDSFEKTPLSDPSNGLFNWMIEPNSINSGNGKIAVKTELVNFVQIQTSEVTVPFLPYYAYTAAPFWPTSIASPVFVADPGIVNPADINLSQIIPNGEKIVAEIKQLSNWAFFDPDGKAHHFEYQVMLPEEDALGISTSMHQLLRPDENFRSFTFNEPVRTFGNELTIQFRNPDIPVIFPQDVFDATVTVATGPVPAAGTLIFNTTTQQNLVAGDRIYVKNFNSTNVYLNKYINDHSKLWVGATGLSNVIFGLDPSLNVLPLGYLPGATIGTGKLYIPKNRTLFSMIFRKLLDKPTNFIYPSGNN